MYRAKCPGIRARGCPDKGVRHRRAEPGHTRLSKDYGRALARGSRRRWSRRGPWLRGSRWVAHSARPLR
eukprot:4653445-Lingulodinium_polyedra.AAC.1